MNRCKTEKFVNDFDDVLDYACRRNNPYFPNYNWGTSKCISDKCPNETCFHLMETNGKHEFKSITSEKTKITNLEDNEIFECVSKHNDSNILCTETRSKPECQFLDKTHLCYEYDPNNNKWDKKTYTKKYNTLGECLWYNDFDNIPTAKTDDDIVSCDKEAVNCSISNYECVNGTVLVAEFVIDTFDDTGKSCKQISPCDASCDTIPPKIAYELKYINDLNVFEPKPFYSTTINGICTFVDENRNEYLVDNVNNKCTISGGTFKTIGDDDDVHVCEIDGQNPIFSKIPSGLENNCTNYESQFCCNLDNKDVFIKYEYIPSINGVGTGCEYRPEPRTIPYLPNDLIVDANELSSFNCENSLFRLCSRSNEFRNILEQKCTPCQQGFHMSNYTAFTHETACSQDIDCSECNDTCYESINGTNTIFIRKWYPRITNEDECIQNPNKSPSCHHENDFGTFSGFSNNGVYMYNCPEETSFNADSLTCDTNIYCGDSSETRKCLINNSDFLEFDVTQEHGYSPCILKHYSYDGELSIDDCHQTCTYPYILNTGNDKCELPMCSFSNYVDVLPRSASPSAIAVNFMLDRGKDDEAKIFELQALSETPNGCRIKKINYYDKAVHPTSPICFKEEDGEYKKYENNEIIVSKEFHSPSDGVCPQPCLLTPNDNIPNNDGCRTSACGSGYASGWKYKDNPTGRNKKTEYTVLSHPVGNGSTCQEVAAGYDKELINVNNSWVEYEQCPPESQTVHIQSLCPLACVYESNLEPESDTLYNNYLQRYGRDPTCVNDMLKIGRDTDYYTVISESPVDMCPDTIEVYSSECLELNTPSISLNSSNIFFSSNDADYEASNDNMFSIDNFDYNFYNQDGKCLHFKDATDVGPDTRLNLYIYIDENLKGILYNPNMDQFELKFEDLNFTFTMNTLKGEFSPGYYNTSEVFSVVSEEDKSSCITGAVVGGVYYQYHDSRQLNIINGTI